MLDVYGTFPASGADPATFTASIVNVGRWAESAGLQGLLVFTDNDSVDPWAGAQYLLERTPTLVPLVAVQPVYMHPYTAARMVTTLASMYGRRIDLNLVAGGYQPHLRALGCTLEHDRRYERLVDYGVVLTRLLNSEGAAVTLSTGHFEVDRAVLNPRLPAGLGPRIFLAGTSDAAADAARRLGAVRLVYPNPPADYATDGSALAGAGIRFGIIARDDSAEAWRLARRRFPTREAVEELRTVHVKHFDAQWHSEIWTASGQTRDVADSYWLYPFRVSREFCPYLVGSHAEVGQLLSRYLDMGITTLILNQPRVEDDLHHAMEAVRHAERLASTSTR